MAFVAEDGTGLVDANSFVDIAFADNYFSSIGDTAWIGEDAVKQGYLIQATSYIVTAFGKRLCCHTKLNEEQALPFPSKEAGMPSALLTATCEYAVRAKAGPLMPDPIVDATGFSVVRTLQKVGPIEREFRVVGGSSQPMLYRSYPYPDSLMRSILCPGSSGNRTIR